MTEKTAKALYALLKELYQSRTAKDFVDVYGREEHEQRRAVPDPAQRALPPDWSDDKQKAYHQLASAVFEGGDFVKIQKAAKSFVEICKHEEREKKPKPDRAWSPAKHQAYNILLDDFLTYAHYDEIVADARRLAAVCEREEHEQRHEKQKHELSSEELLPDHVCDEEKHESKNNPYEHEQRHEAQKREEPKAGDVYRDVLGQRLVVTEIDSMNYGNLKNVIFYSKKNERKLPLEEFIRCFQKV